MTTTTQPAAQPGARPVGDSGRVPLDIGIPPNVLHRHRKTLGLSHAEIDAYARQLADAEGAAWPGE